MDAHAVADIRIEKRSRRDSSNAPSPTIFRPTKKQVALDKRIWQASTLDDLLSLALEHTSKFSASSLCNILARSSQLLRTGSAEQRARFRKHEAVKVVFTELANTPSSHFNATDIPAALQACAWLRLAPPGGLLLKFDRRMQAMMAPMMLAGGGENMALPFINALWAFAKLGYRCEHVLTGLESHILQGSHLALNQCTCTDIAALLWSCAKLQYRSPAMLTVISQEFLGRSVSSLSPANVSQICWAYANLNWSPRYLLLEPLALRAVDCKDAFTVQGLSCTAWALGKLLPQMSPQSSKVLKDCICHLLNQASVTMDSFPIEGVSMVLIAAADANIRHDQLLEATQKRVEESLLSNCGPKDLADIVTAYATLDHPLKQSVADALAVRAQQLLPSFSAVWLSWLFWGFARLGQTPTGLLHAADSMWEQNSDRLRELQPVQQCRLAWAIAQMDHPSGAFWENVASCATNSLVDMKPTELSGLLASFATIGHTPTELLEPAAEHVARHMSSYPPRYLATALWAFGKLGIHPGRGVPDGGPAALNGEPLLSGVAAHVARRVHEFQPRELSMLSWSFATLEHHPGDEYLCATARRLAELIKRGQPVGLQAISTVAWACAKFKFSPIELFQIVAGSAAELLVLSIDQEGGVDDDVVPKQAIKRSTSIANLAFAAAKVGFYDAELFRSISQAALLEMDSISCGEACMLLWSFATLHATPAPELLSACMLRMRESLLSCDPSLVALGVYALGSLLKTHEGHTDLLSKCVTRIAIDRDMNSNLLAKVLWACGSLGWVPPEKPLQRILQTLQKDETVSILFEKDCICTRAIDEHMHTLIYNDVFDTPWVYLKINNF